MVRLDPKTVVGWTTLRGSWGANRGERAVPYAPSSGARRSWAVVWPVRVAFSLALTAAVAPPAFAQNAASIPAVVTVLQSPLASAQTGGSSSWAPSGGGRVPVLGGRVFLLAGLATLVTEGVEPAVVRVRLEYVGN